MSLDSKAKFDLKRLVKRLQQYRGSHTELVSVYVPSGYDLNNTISQLQQEVGTAANIKSASTRKNVTDALERMIQHLRLVDRTPPNGYAAFSGNVAEREGQQDVEVFGIEPPMPLKTKIYRCDKQFVTEPLDEMTLDRDMYGLAVLDQRDATLALLKGKVIVPVKTTHSEVPGKMRAGGQSAPRFARIRQDAINSHFKKIAQLMKEQFLTQEGLRGIILGGPGTTVNNFMNTEHFGGEIKKKIIAVKDLSYTGEFGLQELLDKSEDILAEEEIQKEKSIMQKFFHYLSTSSGKCAYGKDDVLKFLEMGAVDVLLLSESLDDDLVTIFEDKAQEFGTKVSIISTDTREGEQLRRIGMVAAILRYDAN